MAITLPLEINANEFSIMSRPGHSTQSHYPVVLYHLPSPPLFVPQSSEITASPVFSLPVPQIVLYGQIAPGWVITQLLEVTLEQDEDGYYIVSDDLFAVYGDGDTRVEALQDYIESLIEYYHLLAARVQDHPPTKALFRRLQRYLRRTAA